MKSNNEEIIIKTTWRIPKSLLKQLKQYGLDNDMTLTQVAMKALSDLLNRGKKEGKQEQE